jgi:hypothetical protein
MSWRCVCSALLCFAAVLVFPSTGNAQSGAGAAKISVTGAGLNINGDYPSMLCGAPYIKGDGMSYQVQAGDYRITIASETRSSGAVPLNSPKGTINVVATVNGKGKNLVRGPRNTGTLTISSDYKKAEAKLELRELLGKDTATLAATFVCK